jgi:hypothetical protein
MVVVERVETGDAPADPLMVVERVETRAARLAWTQSLLRTRR